MESLKRALLVTGASRGIGLELAKQYAERGWRVYATCRCPENAHALTQLAVSSQGNVSVHPLDVTDLKQIAALAALLQNTSIDILFNNAGIYGQADAHFGNTDVEAWLQAFRSNTIGPMKVMEAFVDNVAASELKIMAVMSSKMGSMADNRSGGSYVYRSSKAALNAVVKSAAVDLRSRQIITVALHPGWVKTDMTGPGALITPQESVAGLRAILERLTLDDSGRFFQVDGQEVPW